MKIRTEKQQKAEKKKGKLSADTFELGDEVCIQNAANKRWDKSGRIKEVRQSYDGQDVSFIFSLANGKETIRHRSHLRHNITHYTRVTDTRVRFNLQEDTEGENKNKEKPEGKKRGRPKKLHKTQSANGYETAPDSTTDSEIGISNRTRSKTVTTSNDIPLKSALKKRTLEL